MRMRCHPSRKPGRARSLPLAVILGPRARPRHDGFVLHAWLHRAGCCAVRDSALVAWYPSPYAPRTGGAYDSHHRTAGIAGCTWRRGSRLATRGAGPEDTLNRVARRRWTAEAGFTGRI